MALAHRDTNVQLTSYTGPGARGNVEVNGEAPRLCSQARRHAGCGLAGGGPEGSRGAHLPSSCSMGSSDTERELSGDLRTHTRSRPALGAIGVGPRTPRALLTAWAAWTWTRRGAWTAWPWRRRCRRRRAPSAAGPGAPPPPPARPPARTCRSAPSSALSATDRNALLTRYRTHF